MPIQKIVRYTVLIPLIFYAFMCKAQEIKENNVLLERIIDGDTIEVLIEEQIKSIRMESVDCFESRNNRRAKCQRDFYNLPMEKVKEKGLKSTEVLKKLIGNNKELKLKWQKKDRYGRILGVVYLNDGTNINEYMLNSGDCNPYIQATYKK